ncbi:MAG: glycosyl hydrolase family 28-related protein, partial [Maribacter sp.]
MNNILQAQIKTTSQLWGANGELWDTRGRLSDFSYAGYGGGNATKSDFTNIINVLDQGVITNDGLSDIAAIDNIIKSAPDNSVIFFPAGRYIIDDWLSIERSNIVIRGVGDGPNGTVFYLPNSATDINGSRESSYGAGDGGHVIEFNGRNRSNVTIITEQALRTDKVIVVEDASELNQWDIIEISADGDNETNGELWHEYFNNQTQNWPEPIRPWLSADGGSMFHTIEKIEGNRVTLREPLRLNLKPSWNLRIKKFRNAVTNVGIENIRIQFFEIPRPDHFSEPGYNALGFRNTFNYWCDNITIEHSDNGILLTNSAYGEIENIDIIGRSGHHALKVAYSANNVLSN